jgi:hypothetical protein
MPAALEAELKNCHIFAGSLLDLASRPDHQGHPRFADPQWRSRTKDPFASADAALTLWLLYERSVTTYYRSPRI